VGIEIVVGVAIAVESPGFDFVFFDEIDAFSAAGGVDFFDDLGVVVVESDVNFFFFARFSFFPELFVGFGFVVVVFVVVIFIVIVIVMIIVILIITNTSTVPLSSSILITTKSTNSGIAKNQSPILERHPQIPHDSLQFEYLDGMRGSNGNRG